MIVILEALLALVAGAGALYLVLRPLFAAGPSGEQQVYDPPELLETRKGRALSALREIEFDRATGKLSDDDYAELKAKYTAEAVALMRDEKVAASAGAAPDVAPTDQEIEAMVQARRQHLNAATMRPACPSCGPRPEHEASFCSSCGRSLAGDNCASCGAPWQPGANFCGGCGAPAPSGQASAAAV